jgi:hypothetical protein
MPMKEINMTVIAIVILSAIIGIASVHYLGPDNAIEEAAEEVIQMETGKSVELTPKNAAAANPSTTVFQDQSKP